MEILRPQAALLSERFGNHRRSFLSDSTKRRRCRRSHPVPVPEDQYEDQPKRAKLSTTNPEIPKPKNNVDGDFTEEEEKGNGNIIMKGECPDMCPQPEREERSRIGDLHPYERLDGVRNQTTVCLAVKKYNRRAEPDASSIRPMPILHKTFDHLLSLLQQPYNDHDDTPGGETRTSSRRRRRFLSIYNFCWDRMRAIRMDLRVQHVCNQQAITMLEQTIRLHIIAVHELCEYSPSTTPRGGGGGGGGGGALADEAFDAHLNVEQMNKTCLELFQMYDDHRKRGINIPTEKEFRGYYALLKLDTHHPTGYVVQPAELSLDLANMTPQIRKSEDVLFARQVARACRTGNYTAFFRLARKATYLQACLMHPHFSKLRTQALASIHAALKTHQGLPVAAAANWLAMDEDEIQSLSQHHGFLLQSFKEQYMMKEGPFLKGDTADQCPPPKCSRLVNMKQSMRIAEDVLASTSSQVIIPFPFSAEATRDQVILQPDKIMHSAAMEEAMPNIDHREDDANHNQQEDIVQEKLNLILRLWKRRSLKLRELREQNQLAEITAAFNSLSLGPPIQQLLVDKPRRSSASFDNEEDDRLLIRRLIEQCNMPRSTSASFDKKGAERLLLRRSIEQCNMLQNSIDKMLYVYGF